jgi:predicted phage baseplate assembly protein
MISASDRPLDVRTFQEIVDHARRVIPRYCPEWTDHNLSDPGITLLELFAWMTEVMLYRLNRVPDEMYERFLDLLGVQREPPVAAATQMTFYVSAASAGVIRAGTEVATPRTEFDDPVVFTTLEDVSVPATTLHRILQRKAGADAAEAETDQEGYTSLFGETPGDNDELRIGLTGDLRGCSIALRIDCLRGEASHLDAWRPPYRWEYQTGHDSWKDLLVLDAAGTGRRVRTGQEPDPAGGFADFHGTLHLHIPRDLAPADEGGEPQSWIRIRHVPTGRESYQRSPRVRFLRCDAVAATVAARHYRTNANEVLGKSNGMPGQRFPLYDSPVVRREGVGHELTVRRQADAASNGHAAGELWQEVPDFSESGPEDRHFVMDYLRGEVRFGPSVPGRAGELRQYGAVPAAGSVITMHAYAGGGGVRGNVREGTITQLRSAIPYVVGVANHDEARGGLDAESLESTRMRALSVIRGSHALITKNDYELLPAYVTGVARCIPVTRDEDRRIPAGEVRLIVIPRAAGASTEPLADSDLQVSAELQEQIAQVLDERRAIGTRWQLLSPQEYVHRFTLEVAAVSLPTPAEPYEGSIVEERAARALYAYFHPVTGGPDGRGYPVGAGISQGAIAEALHGVRGITYVSGIQISDGASREQMVLRPAPGRLLIAEKIAVDVRVVQ